MPLQSQLFTGDSALEACLTQDARHITKGAAGRHVSKIQQALQTLDSARIAPEELAAGRYGQSTAAAVLAYKTRRRIINRAYQATPDDIVGKMTIASLDNELVAKQQGANNRVRCGPDDVGGGGAAVRLGLVGTAASGSPRDEALRNKPEALRWLGQALLALQAARTLMQSGLTADLNRLASSVEGQALNTHFHLDRHPTPLKFLSDLGRTYSLMNIAVSGAETNFAEDPTSNDIANADTGGFFRRNDPVDPGRMFFCPRYVAEAGPLTRVVTIIHEAAHYVDKKIDHFATSVPFPDGRPLTGTLGQKHVLNYVQLRPDDAAQNAASYAGFAIHVFKRQDTRPVLGQ